MDENKLNALRQKYADAKGGDVHDPNFKKVADLLFEEGGKRALPYGGVPTLLDAPYWPEAQEAKDFGACEIALIGVPMDLGVTNRPGARFGPRAVRSIERIGPYNHFLKVTPTAEAKVADIGDVPMRSRFNLTDCIHDIEAFYQRIADTGVKPLSIGGDHSISYPILKAIGREKPLGLVHIDAHCDTSGEYDGAKFHHGGPFRLATLDGAIDPERTIQIGIRGSAEFLWEFSYDAGMTVVHAEEFAAMGVEKVIEMTRTVIGDEPFYISFDVDGLDPVYAPGTGTPEAGGLSVREAQQLLRGLSGLDIVGGDVVEIAPQYDATSLTAMNGGQIAFEILSLMVLNLK